MSARDIATTLAVLAMMWPLSACGESRQTATVPCTDAEVVSARGTDQDPGPGNNGQSLLELLRSKLSGKSIRLYAVDYPATSDMLSSVKAGVDDGGSYVQTRIASCPNTKMVLTGYSQGAAVIDEITDELPPEAAGHIAAVALFGNLTSATAKKLAGGRLYAISPLYRGKTIDLCLPNDPVCTDGDDWNAHSSYVKKGMTEKAAVFVASKL